MILDTDFVVDIMLKEETAIRKSKELQGRGEPQIITTPTLVELYSGVAQSEVPDAEKQKILNMLSSVLIWPLDVEGAVRGGEIDGKLSNQGMKIEIVDCMIAGIAIVRNQAVLTRNIKHFSRISGLKLETY